VSERGSPVSALRGEQRQLRIGAKVVVYVPWQGDFDRPYWQGKITERKPTPFSNNGVCYVIDQGREDNDHCLFNSVYTFPERLRDKVRYVGKSGRLRVEP
jgi:hypothetical protein